MHKHRILIADDHGLVAEGLRSLLAETYEVVGISPNGRRVLVDAVTLKPEVIVLDVGMPELNGIDAASQLVRLLPGVKLVFVTQQIDVHYLSAAFRAGGVAYVAKQSATQELLTAIRCALAGEIYVTPLLKDALPNLTLEGMTQSSSIFARELTQRQREVLQLVAEGKTVKEISAVLQISPKTVEFHKNALMNEIGLRTTAELTRYAISQGIITG
ncbi:MAG: response regulator transcription factor [Acidobacteriaceae bacterium]